MGAQILRFFINLFNMTTLVFIVWFILQIIIEVVVVLWKWVYSGLDMRLYFGMGIGMGVLFAIFKTIKDYRDKKRGEPNKLTVHSKL